MAFANKVMVVTDAGLTLDAQVKATGANAHFTRFGFGEGVLGSADPTKLTGLIVPVVYKAVNRTIAEDNKATAFGTLDPSEIPRVFTWREFAIFAIDTVTGAEIMYAYYADDSDTPTVLSPTESEQQVLRVGILISRTDKVTFTATTAYVTEIEMEALLATLPSKTDLAEFRNQMITALETKQSALTTVDVTATALGWLEYMAPGSDAQYKQMVPLPELTTEMDFGVTFAGEANRKPFTDASIRGDDTTSDGYLPLLCDSNPGVDVIVRVTYAIGSGGGAGGAGITEAPLDGKAYVRVNGEWVEDLPLVWNIREDVTP